MPYRPLMNLLATVVVFACFSGASARRLLVIPEDGPARRLGRQLVNPLALQAKREVLLLGDVARNLAPPIEPAPAATAAALASAIDGAVRRYYHHRDPKEASAAIAASVDAAIGLLPRLARRRILWAAVRRGLLLMATSFLAAKQEARSAGTCGRIASRDPDFVPPPADVPPRVRKVYAAERRRIYGAAATLRIAAPKGTKIFVDGIGRGVAPLAVQVPIGSHQIQGQEDGVLSAPLTVAVPAAGARASVSPYCSAAANLATGRCRQFARHLAGADDLLVLSTQEQSLNAELWRGEQKVRSITAPLPVKVEARWVGELAAYALGQRTQPPVLVNPVVRIVTGEPRVSAPFYKRWWFWTLVGLAVGGGVAAAVAPRGSPTMDFTFAR